MYVTIRRVAVAAATAAASALTTTLPALVGAQVATMAPAQWQALPWRYIGPEGNRFSAAAGIPGDHLTYLVGAASGGIYKTTDGGVNWRPVFDAQPVQSIGALAIAPSDPKIVWAGTGEGKIRSHVSIGQGVYRSADGGETWTLKGLERTGRIPRLVVHPRDPNTALVCALGHSYGPQPERGVFRTTDGGNSWTHVLSVDENTGCSDLAMDPGNPQVLFAGMWQFEIKTWGRTSGGPGSGLFVSRDGGVTWTRLRGNGLPTKPVGKVAVAIAHSDPQRVYALIETGDGIPWNGQPTEDGQLWGSRDGGHTWSLVTRDRNAMGRAHYYSRMAVAPDNADLTYFLTASFAVSTNGGETLRVLERSGAPGGDHHDIWIDPTNAKRMIVAHDQGLSISQNRGETWFRQRLTNAQMYHVTVDNRVPYNVLGNKQDEPTYRGPSNGRLANGRIVRGMWHAVGGGESGWATPDPVDPNVVWSSASGSGMVGGIVVRYEEDRRQFRTVEVWPDQSRGPASGVKYRFVWDSPLHISPHDHETVYVGSQHVHRTRNRGQSWEVISPDLTRNDRTRMVSSGGLTPDNIGVEYAGVVFALTESPRDAGLIWVGTNDGLVHLTRDAGRTWTNVTANIPGLPVWGSVRSIAPSRHDAGTAYLTVDAHQVNDRDPHVFRTTDFGQTWTRITTGIPRSNMSYAKVIAEDPVKPGLLYLGTENAIYASWDHGAQWHPLQNNLPHAPVYGIVVQEHFNDLVIGTYGRGFWILDDLAPLQQLSADVMTAGSHFFAPRAAYRFRFITAPSSTYDDPTIGDDPPYGASLNYWLAAPAREAPRLTISDSTGRVVRRLRGSNVAGINRVTWDLRDEPGAEARLLTSPMYAEHIIVDSTGRSAQGVSRISILMPPGTYTVALSVNGRSHTQPLVVRKDPNAAGTEAEIMEQVRLLSTIREDMNVGAEAVSRIETMRVALAARRVAQQDRAFVRAADALDARLTALAQEFVDLRLTGQGQDGVRFEAKLLQRMGYLAGALASADFPPTSQQREVQTLHHELLQTHLRTLERIIETELRAINALLTRRALPIIPSQARLTP